MNEPLRGCPTCGTKVTEAALGPRDFRWVAKALPGRVAPMDIDFVLERHGHYLFIEFKPEDARIGTGATITYKGLVRAGYDVWVIRGEGPFVEFGVMQPDGHVVYSAAPVHLDSVATTILTWFMEAGNE